MPYGAFCVLPEYDNLEAFMHISEVAPRWIKNIHEFLSEGQRCVVKVYHVDPKKQQVDVSLKRVSEEEKRRKLEAVQNERRAEKLLEFVVKSTKTKISAEKIREELEKQYEDLFSAFRAASYEGAKALEKVKLPKTLKTKIVEIAQKSIKKPTVKVSRTFSLICYGGKGVETLKKVLKTKAEVLYLGAPHYRITVVDEDYKSAEKKIAKIMQQIEKAAQKYKCDFSYDKQ